MKLGELRKGTVAIIVRFSSDYDSAWRDRLLEMGFLEGSEIEVLHEAPFGRDPLAVRIRGSVVALRRADANSIEVEPVIPNTASAFKGEPHG